MYILRIFGAAFLFADMGVPRTSIVELMRGYTKKSLFNQLKLMLGEKVECWTDCILVSTVRHC